MISLDVTIFFLFSNGFQTVCDGGWPNLIAFRVLPPCANPLSSLIPLVDFKYFPPSKHPKSLSQTNCSQTIHSQGSRVDFFHVIVVFAAVTHYSIKHGSNIRAPITSQQTVWSGLVRLLDMCMQLNASEIDVLLQSNMKLCVCMVTVCDLKATIHYLWS